MEANGMNPPLRTRYKVLHSKPFEIPGIANTYQELLWNTWNCKDILCIAMKSHELLRTMSIDTGAVVTNPREHARRGMALLNKWSLNTGKTGMYGKELLVNPVPWVIVIKPLALHMFQYLLANVLPHASPGSIWVDARFSLNNLLPIAKTLLTYLANLVCIYIYIHESMSRDIPSCFLETITAAR